jgi:hypothetical protein
MFGVSQAQGLRMNQAFTFLTDGGYTVRDLIEGLNPVVEYIFNWFLITITTDLTALDQMAKGVAFRHKGEKFEKELEQVKWYLWHGIVFKALQVLEDLAWDIDAKASNEAKKLARSLHGFDHFIHTNHSSIPNYGNRYEYGRACPMKH